MNSDKFARRDANRVQHARVAQQPALAERVHGRSTPTPSQAATSHPHPGRVSSSVPDAGRDETIFVGGMRVEGRLRHRLVEGDTLSRAPRLFETLANVHTHCAFHAPSETQAKRTRFLTRIDSSTHMVHRFFDDAEQSQK